MDSSSNVLAAMPKYESYTDSGHTWIGSVPTNWEITKLGACLKPVSTNNRPDLPLLSITREKGVIKRDIENQESNHNFIPDDLSGYKVLKEGQFGMNKMKAWQGSYGVSSHTGIVSPAYFIFDFSKVIEPKFFNWAIRSKLYVSYFGSASDGVRIGQWDLSKERMKMVPFILPSLNEQTNIANFLDKKTAQIDEAIAIKEKQIALLKERKQIIIQKAVTQGLNPNVPMKDSGEYWISDIPEHWEVRKLKHLFYEKKHTKNMALNCGSISFGKLVTKDDEKIPFSTKASYQEVLSGEFLINPLNLNYDLISLRIALSKIDVVVSAGYIVLKEKVEINREYFNYLLHRYDVAYMKLLGSGVRQTISFNHIANSLLILPPEAEQLAIANFLDKKTAQIDEAIEIQKRQIEKLKEYKTTLINSAVTGKIKVV